MADSSGLFTTVKNTFGVDHFFGYIPPHGKKLSAGQSYTVPGDLATRVVTHTRYDRRRFRSLERDLIQGRLQIEKTPAPILADAAPAAAITPPTVAATSAESVASGALAAGTYWCAYTWYSSLGETGIGASTIAAAFTVTDTSHRTTITIPSKPAAATGAKIYISDTNGSAATMKLYGTTATTTFAATTAPAALATPPVTNTAVIADPTVQPGVNVTGGGATNGLLAAGAYFLKYTFITPLGETLASPESDKFTVATGNVPQVVLPPLPNGAVGINLYLTAAAGGTGTETLQATGVTSGFYFLAAAGVVGAALPGASTALLPAPVFTPLVAVAATGQDEAGTSGGQLQSGTYYMKVTYSGPTGETTASPESLQFNVASSGLVPVAQILDDNASFPAGVTGANVYLTAAGGAAGSEKLYMTAVVTRKLRLTLATGQTPPPVVNTTGGRLSQALNVSAGVLGAVDPSWGPYIGPA